MRLFPFIGALAITHACSGVIAASQVTSPVVLVEVGSTPAYREVVHAQQAQDHQLVLTPDSCFFFPFGPNLTGQQPSSLPGAEFNGGNTFETITNITRPGQLIQWPVLPMNDGTWNIEVFIDTPYAGVELIIRLGDVGHTVTTVASDGTTPQPWNLSAAVTNTGATTAAVRWFEIELVDLHGAPALGQIVKSRLHGPSMADDFLLRARWRPAAIHGGFQSSSLAATGLGSDLFVMEQVADYSSPVSLNFYAPITTSFGYYGSVFAKVPDDPDGSFTASNPNFSMWNYGQGAESPPLPTFSHLLALGDADLTFGGFTHEGTGVKPRGDGWALEGRPLASFVSALAFTPADPNEVHPFTRYTGSFWDPHEQRWRLYAVGNKRGVETFRLPSSFIEVPGRATHQRTGQVVRRMLFRGWIRDTNGDWHPIDSQAVGSGPGQIVNKVWDKSGDGWLVREMGGVVHREYLQAGQTVTITPPAGLPPYVAAEALADLAAPPMSITMGRIVARPDDTLEIGFHLEGNPIPAEVRLYHGGHDGLTLIYEDNNQPDEWNGPLSLGVFAAGSHTVTIPGNGLPDAGYGRLLVESAELGRFWTDRSARWLAPLEPPPLPVGAPAGTPVAQVNIDNPTPGRTVTYALVSGNDDGLFTLDPASGEITLAREAMPTDVGNPPLTLTATLDGWSGRLPAIHVAPGITTDLGAYAVISSDSIAFGHHSTLTGPFRRRVTVTNIGSEALMIHRFNLTGDPGFHLAGPLPGLIAPGGSADLDLAFAPLQPGHFSATLTLTTNDWFRPSPTIQLSGGLDPGGFVIASFNFDPGQHAGNLLDLDNSAAAAWTTSPLVDQSTLGDIDLRDSATGKALRFRSLREADDQTPLDQAWQGASTWVAFTVAPTAADAAIGFTGGSATLDTYAWSSLGGNTSSNWTLYFSTDDGGSWTSLGTRAGALITGSGTAGPLNLGWDLSQIGSPTGPVRFILDPSTAGFATNGSIGQRAVGCENLVLTVASIAPPEDAAQPPPDTLTIARFDFSPNHIMVNAVVDVPAAQADGVMVGNLIDHATGTGALSSDNQHPNNRAIADSPVPHLRLSSRRESDGQTPAEPGGDNQSTWLTFHVTPIAGHVIDFSAARLAIDTFANSTLSGVTSANWTLYHRRDDSSHWTAMGTFEGASVSGPGAAGPVALQWALCEIGTTSGTVHFLIDPQTAEFGTNGVVGQRGIGLGNIRLDVAWDVLSGFAAWAAGHGIADPDPEADVNGDGLSLGVQFALGRDPHQPGGSPAILESGTLTFPKGAGAVAAGVVFRIEASTDLGATDPWQAVTPEVNNEEIIRVTFPTTGKQSFYRLAVELP